MVVYAAGEQETVQPILDAFQRETSGTVRVNGEFNVRSTKASALVSGSRGADEPPRCDLFWDNEVLPTIRLQQQGRLQRHDFPVPSNWPRAMVAADSTWCGFAARARVLLVNQEAIEPDEEFPSSVADLADARWQGRCGMATPLGGTAATHWAVLREKNGTEATLAMLDQIRDNGVVLAEERQIARAVSAGQLAWGLIDSDLAMIEQDLDYPVEIIFPDQSPDQPGTLRIPNTVAILRGASHPVAAGRLVDFLLTPEIEDRLAMGAGSHIPLSREGKFPPAVLPGEPVRWMRVDFEAAADGWDAWVAQLQAIFTE